ncbi:MAG: hypothetical protein EBQ92_01445 [Proteobacteria bacterium]|nr:hypothetical protein [Pseudomonadota bacterium]
MEKACFKKRALYLFLALLGLGITSCTQQLPLGPVNMMVIQPVGPSCQYQIKSAPLQTMENISNLQGLLGRVVVHPEDLESSPDILQLGLGFQRLDVQFSGSNGSFAPLDKDSLLGASLYYGIETGYLLFKNLDPAGDLLNIVPNMRDTYIVQNAELKSQPSSSELYSDNAAYAQIDGANGKHDYFLHFPNKNILSIPLGFNAGVLIHEYAHMVAQYLFHNKRSEAGKNLSSESENTLAAFEEGFADYFAFLATADPAFFHCSFPQEEGNRDVSQPKFLTTGQLSSITSSIDFDSHEGGAVWASVQYQIGQLIGHEVNGRSLVRFINNLASCTGLASSRASVSFGTLKNCHLQALGASNNTRVQQLYQNAFGAAGGF